VANNNLIHYITEKRKLGYDSSSIRQALLGWGYNPQDVDETITQSFLKQEKNEGYTKPDKLSIFISNMCLGVSLKYFLFASLFFLVLRAGLFFLVGFLARDKLELSLVLILANSLVACLFLFVVFFIFLFFSIIYYFIFKYFLKQQVNFGFVFAAFLVAAIPYILANSFVNLPFFGWLAGFNISLGFLSFNLFFLLMFVFFAFFVSRRLNMPYFKALFCAMAPLAVIGGTFGYFFYDALNISFLGFVL